MLQIDLKSRKSIYEQVVDDYRALIIKGVMKPGEKMPSVRELSRELTVNPNTVQKAYRELERLGYINTVAGKGCFVAEKQNAVPDSGRVAMVINEIRALVTELMYMGLSREDVSVKIGEILNEGGGGR
ncbi:MAG: GntR family transcriptional regulator [Clostridia bacterium]|nr:GntR family transcriptional regulator [Clostridia bacterium]